MKHPLQIAACCVLLIPFQGAMAEGGYYEPNPYLSPNAPQPHTWNPSYPYDRYQLQGERMRSSNPIYTDTTYYPPQTRRTIEGFNPYTRMYRENLQFRPWNDQGTIRPGNNRGFQGPGNYQYDAPAPMPSFRANQGYPYPTSPQRGFDNVPGYGYRRPSAGYGQPGYGYPPTSAHSQPYYNYPSSGFFTPTPDTMPYGEWQEPMPLVYGSQASPEWDYLYPEFRMPGPDFERGIAAPSRQRTTAPALDRFDLYELPLPAILDDRAPPPPSATKAVAPVPPADETVTPAAPLQQLPATAPQQLNETKLENTPEDVPPMTEESQSTPAANELPNTDESLEAEAQET